MRSSLSFESEFLIIGAGIVGLTIARELKLRNPSAEIIIIDKESNSISHGSGRNSGVIHAGFYYPADSLKAKLTCQGNKELTQYCLANNVPINRCGKLVVAQNKTEVDGIYELEKRAKANGVDVSVVSEQEALAIEPNAKTCEVALFSPTTASADPKQVTGKIAQEVLQLGVQIHYQTGFSQLGSQPYSHLKSIVQTTNGCQYQTKKVINCAGLYADYIAKQFGFANNYAIVPFKGIYLKYQGTDQPIKTNIYPVPNLNNPFLGVHYTVTVNNEIKIGPTAIPAFWRENYQGLSNFNLFECTTILKQQAQLWLNNSFNFRRLAVEEMRKYQRRHFVELAANMVKDIDQSKFTKWTAPGIRAQLLNTKTLTLEQDFVIEGNNHSIHILNAVSPAWTSSIPFARYVVDNYLTN